MIFIDVDKNVYERLCRISGVFMAQCNRIVFRLNSLYDGQKRGGGNKMLEEKNYGPLGIFHFTDELLLLLLVFYSKLETNV